MKNLDFSKPNVIIITVIIILITFAIIYIYSNRSRYNSKNNNKILEGFAQYSVNAGDIVALNALDNVVIGSSNPITLTESINKLITDAQSAVLDGYVTTSKLKEISDLTNKASETNTKQENDIANLNTLLTNKLTDFQSKLDAKSAELQTQMDTTIRTSTALATGAALPALTIIAYYGDQPPAGWQICDGQTLTDVSDNPVYYKRTENGTPIELKTPNLLGRMIIGASKDRSGTTPRKGLQDINNNDLTSRAVGDYGGEELHKMTLDELVKHNHSITYNSQGSTLAGCWYNGGLTVGCCGQDKACRGDDTIIEKTINGNNYILPKGGDKPFNIMSPYFVLLYIIKKPLNGGRSNALTLPFGNIDVPTTTAAITTTPATTNPSKPW